MGRSEQEIHFSTTADGVRIGRVALLGDACLAAVEGGDGVLDRHSTSARIAAARPQSSNDGTSALLTRLQARYSDAMRLITQPVNRGKGAALQRASS